MNKRALDWIKGRGAAKLAGELNITRQLVYLWLRGERDMTWKTALEIEKISGGEILRSDFIPEAYAGWEPVKPQTK